MTEAPVSPPMFEIIEEQEARMRVRAVRLAAALEPHRPQLEAGLAAVQQGQRFHVRPPREHAEDERALKAAIRRVATSPPFSMRVRFDPAREGFIVRLATDAEQQRAIERGNALTAARHARRHTQRRIAQSILAQPASPESGGTEHPRDIAPQESMAASGEAPAPPIPAPLPPEAAPARDTATAESAAASGAPPVAPVPSTPRRRRRKA